MSDSTEVIPFGIVDYVVFSAMLAVSASTGIYHCFAGGGQKTTSRFLAADRKMPCAPIAMSMFVTVTSSASILGYPAEVYIYGVQYTLGVFAMLFSFPFAAYFIIPVIRGLPITSAFEYIGLRYNLSLRITCAVIALLHMLLTTAITMYAPALAIAVVQDFEVWKMTAIIGSVTTFYTTLGGMKAVIWADVFQFFVIFGSVVAVAVLGTDEVGGIERVWNLNNVGDRLNFFNFSLDPTVRLTFLAIFVNTLISSLYFGVGQAVVQRHLASKSTGHAQGSVLLNIPIQIMVRAFIFFNGLVLYAYYNNEQTSLIPAVNATFSPETPEKLLRGSNNPVRYEPNYSKSDQILMSFVSSQFGRIPGVQGLFVASLMAGSLSTISSSVNAVAASILQDIVKPWRKWKSVQWKTRAVEKDDWDTTLSKIISCVFGVLATLTGFLVPYFGSLVVITSIVVSVFSGPLTAVYILGMMLRRTNAWGTFCGLVAGCGIGLFIVAGPIVAVQLDLEPLPIHKISFMWYSSVIFFTTFIVGVVASELFRFLKPSLIKEVDPLLLVVALRPKHRKIKSGGLIEDFGKSMKATEVSVYGGLSDNVD
ncbi:sodium-dependent multivitamin transporter-like [Ptychodera flava]|uniref:sodium-dependent multivitamin transporter-like n=1 Tax=Ptychodera flava TaxID=63121 RepID=UPI00396A24AE